MFQQTRNSFKKTTKMQIFLIYANVLRCTDEWMSPDSELSGEFLEHIVILVSSADRNFTVIHTGHEIRINIVHISQTSSTFGMAYPRLV